MNKKDIDVKAIGKAIGMARRARAKIKRPPRTIYFLGLGYCGFGYPAGYRIRSAPDIMADEKLYELVAVGGDSRGIKKTSKERWGRRVCTTLCVEYDEFSYEDVENILSAYLGYEVKWGVGEVMGEEEEHEIWAKGHKQSLEWLAKGAQPRGSVIPDTFFSKSRRNCVVDALEEIVMEKGSGYRKTKEGWVRDADRIVDLPFKTVKRIALKYAKQEDISGDVYVSGSSWPLPIHFVADGKRHDSHPRFDDAGKKIFYDGGAWVAYYSSAKLIRLLPQEQNIFFKSGEPDVLPALRKVSG